MKSILSIFSVYFLLCGSGLAQSTVIEKPGGAGSASFDFSGFSSSTPQGGKFYRSLRTNLTLSSFFSEAPPSRADLRVLGSVVPDGGKFLISVQITGRSDRRNRYAKRFRASEDQLETVARTVADEVTQALTGTPGFASSRIAFIGLLPGVKGKEIYMAYPDGGGLIQLTRDSSVKLGLEWAPDAKSLIYTSYHRGFPDIYQHTLSPARRMALSSSSGINAGGSLSPDGKVMAMILSKDGRPELYVKDLARGQLIRLTRTPMSAKSSPSWSPDGRSIVFTSSHDGLPHLYVISRSGGAPKRITRGGGENLSPDWGSNGLIVFTRRRNGLYQTAVMNPATGDLTFISPADGDYEDPSWAPDGVHVVVSKSFRGQSSLYLLDRAGKQSKALLQGQGSWYMPSWAP